MSHYLKSQQKLIDDAFAKAGAAPQRRVPAPRAAAKRKVRNGAARRAKA